MYLALVSNFAPETKLLKTGNKVPLGRRDKPLLVNNKKISRDHCEFIVGPCTQDDVVGAQANGVTLCSTVAAKSIVCPDVGDIQCKG